MNFVSGLQSYARDQSFAVGTGLTTRHFVIAQWLEGWSGKRSRRRDSSRAEAIACAVNKGKHPPLREGHRESGRVRDAREQRRDSGAEERYRLRYSGGAKFRI